MFKDRKFDFLTLMGRSGHKHYRLLPDRWWDSTKNVLGSPESSPVSPGTDPESCLQLDGFLR